MEIQPQVFGFIATIIVIVSFVNADIINEYGYLILLFIVMDIAALAGYSTRKKVYKKMQKDANRFSEEEAIPLSSPATITVIMERSIVGAIVLYSTRCSCAKYS